MAISRVRGGSLGSGLQVIGSALAAFEYEVTKFAKMGPHGVFFAQVLKVLRDEGTPLVYGNGRYCAVAGLDPAHTVSSHA